MDGQMDRWTDGWMDTQVDGWTDQPTDGNGKELRALD